MKSNLPKSAKDIKGKVALAELKRAHLIIAVLAAALAFVVVVEAVAPISFNLTIAVILAVLLALVAAVSLTTVAVVGRK